VEAVFQLLYSELKQSTRSSDRVCGEVADRILDEVSRICGQSQHIQSSGDVEAWATKLGRHRLQQCLAYYKLGSRAGRVELHGRLSAIVYRYVAPPQLQTSYQGRLLLIEDFLQGFYAESLNALRRETQLDRTYSPRVLLELAEYMAFTQRYAKRRISLPGGRSQQLIVLRAQTFSQQQPPELSVDIEQTAEVGAGDSDYTWNDAIVAQIREQSVDRATDPGEANLHQKVIDELVGYLESNNHYDCANYFVLRLADLSTAEIEAILGLTPRQRDYLQQRFKYHLIRFALSHNWELVHQWLDADLDRNLGLTASQWQIFLEQATPSQQHLLELKQGSASDGEIAEELGCSVARLKKQWFDLLKRAWEIRNDRASGEGTSKYE